VPTIRFSKLYLPMILDDMNIIVTRPSLKKYFPLLEGHFSTSGRSYFHYWKVISYFWKDNFSPLEGKFSLFWKVVANPNLLNTPHLHPLPFLPFIILPHARYIVEPVLCMLMVLIRIWGVVKHRS